MISNELYECKCNKDYLHSLLCYPSFIVALNSLTMKEPLQLGICEHYNASLHGPCHPHVAQHFLFMYDVPLSEFYDNSCAEFIATYPHTHAHANNDNFAKCAKRPTIEIAQPVVLEPGGECVAIIKTFWIRLIQRRWKRVFAERRRRLAQLLKPYGLLKRECGIK
jgi:hypothetical protein